MRFADVLMSSAAAAQGRGSIDPDVALWIAAVVVNGGTVSSARAVLASALVAGLKESGSWQLTDDIWLLVAENAGQALTSLKQRRLASEVSSPTFGADTGYTFNGSTNYLNTGFVPRTHAVAMTASNVRLSAYERTNVATNTVATGVSDATNQTITIRPRNSTVLTAAVNTNGENFTLVVADSRGLSAVSRNGTDATTALAYKNGSSLTRSADPTGFGTLLPNIAMFIGGSNTVGSLAVPRAANVGFVSIGSSLSAGQELAFYNTVQAFMTAVGANV